MATTVRSLVLLDPTVEPDAAGLSLAPRFDRLDGKVAGLLDNSKAGAAPILESLARLLQDRYGVKEVVFARKNDASTVAPPEVLDLLIKRCNFVVAGVGD